MNGQVLKKLHCLFSPRLSHSLPLTKFQMLLINTGIEKIEENMERKNSPIDLFLPSSTQTISPCPLLFSTKSHSFNNGCLSSLSSFFFLIVISPIQFFYTVQHGDPVTHTCIHSFFFDSGPSHGTCQEAKSALIDIFSTLSSL